MVLDYEKGPIMPHLLLIDDDPALILRQIHLAFPTPSYRIEAARTGAEGIERICAERPDVVLLDVRLPDQSGLEVFQQIHRLDRRIPVIFVTVVKTADETIEAMRQGAYDYLFKPLDLHQLRRVVGEALEVGQRMYQQAVLSETDLAADKHDVIVGSCPAMREVYKAIGRVADQNVPVLITGESGTGKELIARAIYQHGPRAKALFLALNCAAIPEQLLESEMFGHEKGAFTGANRRRIGKFEQCNGGTLFLDEIGDMSSHLQAKILRVVQEQTFERLGGNETIRTNVRLIAATHRDLKAWSAEGKFRPDLYYRLAVFTIHLPSLRERSDDLPMLVQLYLRRFSRELGREVREVAPETLDRLRGYSWPGNIRELQSVIKQALLQAHGEILLPEFLPADLPVQSGGGTVCETAPRFRPGMTLAEVEREAIQHCLFQTGGNRQRAAELLRISTRTLLRKIREYGLEDPRRPTAPASGEHSPEH
jgi:two-component system, NtrC family, response regulator AtoC